MTAAKLQGSVVNGSAVHGNCLLEARRRELGETKLYKIATDAGSERGSSLMSAGAASAAAGATKAAAVGSE